MSSRRSFRSKKSIVDKTSRTETKGNGGIIRINFHELERSIEKLSKYHYVKLTEINSELDKYYRHLTGTLPILYDTERYSTLCDLLRKHFSDIQDIKPGTIGSYCYGCLSQVGKSFNSLCTPICSNSIRSESSHGSCDNTVISALTKNKDTDDYNLKVISTGDTLEGRSHAYVHINCERLSDFDGFTSKEKRKFERMGIKQISLIGYKSSKLDYVIFTDWISLSKCKSRKKVSKYSPLLHATPSQENAGGLVIIILIILALIILGYNFIYRRRAIR